MNNMKFIGHIIWVGPIKYYEKDGVMKPFRDFVIEEEPTGEWKQRIVLSATRMKVLTVIEQIEAQGIPSTVELEAFIDTRVNHILENSDRQYGKLYCWNLLDKEGGQA